MQLPGAIRIEPLTPEQVKRHLARGGPCLNAIRQTLDEDPELWALLDTPLMLSIFILLAYADQPPTVPQHQGDLEARRHQVFAAYVEQMFQRRRAEAPYTPEQTRHWLAWLATQMTRNSLTVFYIEWLQPDWLPNQSQQRFLRAGRSIVIGLSTGLVIGLSTGLVIGLSTGLVIGLSTGLSTGLIGGLIAGLLGGPRDAGSYKPTEVLHWSWSEMQSRLADELVAGLSTGLIIGLVAGLSTGLVVGLSFGLSSVLMIALIIGLVGGLRGETLVTRTIPNEGIRRVARNARYSGLLGGLIFWLIVGLIGLPGSGPVYALVVALVVALYNGGHTCIQHILIRGMLMWNGSAPWRYAAFLDYAAERILLRKVGGGYMFIHRYLLDYFARLESVGPTQAAKPSSSG